MDTPQQLASLEGQQYLVLRPSPAVAAEYERTQAMLLAGPASGLPHPYTGHVTLRGFFEPGRRAELASLIRAWGAAQPPIELSTVAVDVFPAPWQIIVLRLARTASLVRAYADLTERLDRTDVRRLGELPLEEWTFHLSVVYGKTLAPGPWAAVEASALRPLTPSPAEVVTEAELVWYEDGAEHAEVIPLGG